MSVPSFLQTLQAYADGLRFSTYKPLLSLSPPPTNTENPVGYQLQPPVEGSPIANPVVVATPVVNKAWYNDPVNFVWDEKTQLYRGFALSSSIYNSPNGGETTWQELVSPDMLSWTPYRFIFDLPVWQGSQDLWGGSFLIDEDGVAGFSPGAVLYFISRPNAPDPEHPGQYISLWVAPSLGAKPMCAGPILMRPKNGVEGIIPESGFRDMRVVRAPDGIGWIAGITIDYGITMYYSTDLLNWTWRGVIDLSEYQQIECPAFVHLSDMWGNSKWFLTFGMKTFNGAYQQCVSYIPVSWTGSTFTADTTVPHIMNWGHDWYAQAISLVGSDAYVWAWVGDWGYNGALYNQGYSGLISNVTKMALTVDTAGNYGIALRFLDTQESRYSVQQDNTLNYTIPANTAAKLPISNAGATWRIDGRLDPPTSGPWPDEVFFDFCVSAQADYTQSTQTFDRTRLVFNFKNMTVAIDRSQCGNRPLYLYNETMQGLWDAVRPGPLPTRSYYTFTIIFDVSFAEIIINDGDVYLTSMVMPVQPQDRDFYIVSSGNGTATLSYVTLRR